MMVRASDCQVPSLAAGVRLRVARTWPDGVSGLLRVMLDGEPWLAFGLPGGPMTNRDGSPKTHAVIEATWPGEIIDGNRVPVQPALLTVRVEFADDVPTIDAELTWL